MLKFQDIVLYLKDLFKMNTVYDCARPFLVVSGIFGIGGSKICEIEDVRSVRNTRLSLIIAMLIALIVMPGFIINSFLIFFSGSQRSLHVWVIIIMFVGRYTFFLSTAAMACIQTHVYCKNLTKILQILNNTDMIFKQENIHANYWKIILTTVLFGLISCDYYEIYRSVNQALLHVSPIVSGAFIVKLFIDTACETYFRFIILFMMIIRERFVGLNKLLLQNAQGSSIMRDNSVLRRISLARDIHEQLSEVIVIFSDASRFIIVGILVPGMLETLFNAIGIVQGYDETEINMTFADYLQMFYYVVHPLIRIVVLTAVCETHKNNRRVLTARLRHLIAFAEDRKIVHQLKQYMLYNHITVAGLVDFQLVDVDFTLLFTIIDIIVSYVFVIHSYYRTPANAGM